MANVYVAAKDLTIDGQVVKAGTPLLSIAVENVDANRVVAALQNGAAVSEAEYKRLQEEKQNKKAAQR